MPPAAVAAAAPDGNGAREVRAGLMTNQRRDANALRRFVSARHLEVPTRRVSEFRSALGLFTWKNSCDQVWLPPACIDQRLLSRLFIDASTVL